MNTPAQDQPPMMILPLARPVPEGVPVIMVFLLLGGIFGEGAFLQSALTHGLPPSLALLVGIAAGSIAVLLLLPWISGRAFSVKGGPCC